MNQLDFDLDDQRKTLRTYKSGPFRPRAHHKKGMPLSNTQVKWAALKQTRWFASIRLNAALEGK